MAPPPRLQEVLIAPRPASLFLTLAGEEAVREAEKVGEAVRRRLEGRAIWNLNSTASGGGVAEMLRALLPYVRGVGIDTRWLIIQGPPEFFVITKRLHHLLHGSLGDGGPLGERERARYEQVLRVNADELQALVRPRDFVILHDPQTAGLAPHLAERGAIVVWRCHIGQDEPGEEAKRGWTFLAPDLDHIAAMVFSRLAFIPTWLDHGRSQVIAPSIDVFSAKNQEMDEASIRAILVHTGLVEGPPGEGAPTFLREDGTPGRVDRCADVLRLGRAPAWETPLVIQISRWDPLKDHLGVMKGFARLLEAVPGTEAELVLAGPAVHAVADDPEQVTVLDELIAAWRGLPHAHRNRIHLACLPMADLEENAAIVNALQRHAAVVVQKSLREGFGLTVTEAMWKERPIVASAVGGIRDQIAHGVQGLLLEEPTDLAAFAASLRCLLDDRPYAERLGVKARQRVQEEYLGLRHLLQYARLLERLDA